jgi:transposase-like protein
VSFVYCNGKTCFEQRHWRRIRTNNPLERLLCEIRRRTRVVGASPDGQSALNLAAARLRRHGASHPMAILMIRYPSPPVDVPVAAE